MNLSQIASINKKNISDYFEYETKHGTWHRKDYKPTEMQKHLWEVMKWTILNPVRHYIGKPIKISSCVRSKEHYDVLLKGGWYPSSTSDHYAGNPIILPKDSPKRKIYGDIFTLSTFACDFSADCDLRKLCRDMFLTLKGGENYPVESYIYWLIPDVKQLILEEQIQNDKRHNWIHVSLPYSAIYEPEYAEILEKKVKVSKFLEMKDGKYKLSEFE